MKNKIVILFVAAATLVSFSTIAQKETPPPGGTPKDFKLSEKNLKKYPNGLKSTLVQYGNLPKVTVSLIIKTGNLHEGDNQVWLADLTGNLMKEGTKTMNFSALSKKAARMGGNINVSTGLAQTTVSGSVLSEYAGPFIELIADLVMNPSLPESELKRLKEDLKRQLSVQKTVPQSQAQAAFFSSMYKGQPLEKIFPTEEMLNSFTIDMVREFYNSQFGAKRSVIYVVGKFDEAAVARAIQNSLGKWKPGPEVKYPPIKENAVAETVIVDRKAAPQTTLMIGLPVIQPTNKDYVPMLVTNSLLGGSFGSRITSNIRENKGYTYSPFSSVSNRKGSTLWMQQADVTSEHTAASLNEIEKEIKRLQNEPPSKEELDGIKNYEAGIFVLRNSSPGGIIGQLNFLDLYGLEDSYLNTLVKNIHSVSPAKVSEITKKYINYDKMLKVMVGDKEQIEKQLGESKPALKPF